MKKAMRITVSVIESHKRVLTDSLSVPKIMGKGPIITAPPPLTVFSLKPAMKSRRKATKTINTPMKMRAIPRL